MNSSVKKEPFVLFVGDVILFVGAIWATLLFRYGELPAFDLFLLHLVPFSFLIVAWILVFLIVGLYEKHTLFLKSRLPATILNAQVGNSALAVFFFYFVDLGITPKRNLFIYLLISVVCILIWRLSIYPLLGVRRKQNAIIIGSGDEMKELREEVNNNSRYNLKFVSSIDPADLDVLDFNEDVLQRIYDDEISVIAVDLESSKVEPFLPHLYNLIFSKGRFIETHNIYEDIFDRIPLSLVKYSWFLENISFSPKLTYDLLKRMMDITLSFALAVVSLILYPFVIVAIKLDDGGALIGPRPEFPEPVKLYESELPYYNIRHLIKPGLSGWAQIYGEHPHHGTDVWKTKNKLSHDLYYIKNRSFWLDIKIALRTVKTLFSMAGR